jgi:Flp pilus assembly protein TadD
MFYLSPAHTSRGFRLFVFASASACALLIAGCSSAPKEEQFATSASSSSSELQNAIGYWGERYKSNPSSAETSYAYARALLAADQRAQAVAVLQRAVLANPYDLNLKGALGNALAANGQYDEALNVFQQAHTPDRPNWRVLSAQGAVLDQMGRPQDARKYYQTALRLSPDEPSILSNLALSYALTGDIATAEKTLEKAAQNPRADARVRQNLALIVGLQGRYSDSERIGSRDLSPGQAQQNALAIRSMISQQNTWADMQNGSGGSFAAAAPAYPNFPYAAPTRSFATSIDQQLYGSGYQQLTPAPYGYRPEPPKRPEPTSWQDDVRRQQDNRN